MVRAAPTCVAEVGVRTDDCPYCEAPLGRSPKRAAVCKACGGRYRVRDRKREDGRRILTEAEALFMDALRGGQLVPHLFYHDPLTTAPEDIPHNRPEVMAECDRLVDEAWARQAKEAGRPVTVGDLLIAMYEGQADGRDMPDYGLGYLRYRQSEIRLLEGRHSEALGLAMEALYADLCAPRIKVDFLRDPPALYARAIDPNETAAFTPRWLDVAIRAARELQSDPSDLRSAFQTANAKWESNPLAQPLPAAWALIRSSFPDY